MMAAWQTVIVNSHNSLSLADENVVISDEERTVMVPISQIKMVMIMSNKGTVSLPLLERFMKQNTVIVFCDSTYKPVGGMSTLTSNFEAAGRHMDQAKWTERKKKAAWSKIIKMKIGNQRRLMELFNLPNEQLLSQYCLSVKCGDSDNREAVAAKVYFNSLFGNEFVRFSVDDINSALNYGYAVLLSAFTRSIVAHGYATEIGIHHCSRNNNYNFACDLMEPFRPFVDRLVYMNYGRNLDREYRRLLTSILDEVCVYDGSKICLDKAIDMYVIDVINYMEEARRGIKEVRIA